MAPVKIRTISHPPRYKVSGFALRANRCTGLSRHGPDTGRRRTPRILLARHIWSRRLVSPTCRAEARRRRKPGERGRTLDLLCRNDGDGRCWRGVPISCCLGPPSPPSGEKAGMRGRSQSTERSNSRFLRSTLDLGLLVRRLVAPKPGECGRTLDLHSPHSNTPILRSPPNALPLNALTASSRIVPLLGAPRNPLQHNAYSASSRFFPLWWFARPRTQSNPTNLTLIQVNPSESNPKKFRQIWAV